MIQVAYSNSNCIDLWEIFQRKIYQYTLHPLYMLCDTEPLDMGLADYSIYSNDEPYYKVWVDGLTKFKSDYFIYLQEDFFLYSDVNTAKLYEYENFLKANPEYSYVRLLKSGDLNTVKITDTLFEIEPSNPHSFAMQATIWKTSDYIKLMEEVKDEKWFENYKYNEAMIKLNMKGLYHYDNEAKRGLNHFDSNVYPYIATALVKGKWNITEYPRELVPMLINNNINIDKRGQV